MKGRPERSTTTRLTGAAFAALLCGFSACGGKAEEYRFSIGIAGESATGGASGGTSAGGGITSSAGVSAASGGVSMTSTAGAAGGPGKAGSGDGATSSEGGQGQTAGGEAGAGPALGASGASDGGASGSAGAVADPACEDVSECPRPSNACQTVSCTAGACVTEDRPAGSLYVLDAPPDCHATTACDGFGHPTLAIDQNNWPTPANPCLAGTCNAAGVPSTEPMPLGTRCNWDFGRGKCNGKGACVTCLTTSDCPLGQTCTPYHDCVGEPCSNLNCGGACPACVGQACTTGSDCGSRVCDQNTLLCVNAPPCVDHVQDGNETDTDCGGGVCALCAVGQACLEDTDCASLACDSISRSCVSDTCVDHHKDYDEADVDCGGSNLTCPRCDLGQGCHSNLDCKPGHTCPVGTVCL